MSATHGQPTAVAGHEHRSRTAETAPPHQRRAYNDAAAQYDAERYESTEGRFFNDFEIEILEEWLRPRPGLKVLELPAGTGRVAVPLAKRGATVIGGDISENMLRVAIDKKQREGASSAHFAQVNGLGLPFADETFDAVTSFKFFHLVPDHLKRTFIEEMARVTKVGGKVVIEFKRTMMVYRRGHVPSAVPVMP